MSKRYRLKVRKHMIDGAMCHAVIAARRGDSPRYAATNHSLPGILGRERLNGPERSVVERLLRTGFDDYSHYRPGSGMVSTADRNRASAYLNPRYAQEA
jgi:hypothetical protein